MTTAAAFMGTSEEVMDVQERLVRVETKLDGLVDLLRTRHSDEDARHRLNDERHRLLDERVRLLETALAEVRVRVAIVSAAIGTFAGVASAVVVHLIGG